MDRESPFRILSLHEFDGLSLEEKLAYLDLQLTDLHGEACRERVADSEGVIAQIAGEPPFHSP